MSAGVPWHRRGAIYQIYPRSFQDSDGDGIGDLRGITARLDHVADLGATGIWLNPIHPSPNLDWGYDVADYLGVHPDLGTLEDLDALIARARALDLHVLLDLVPNHTSDQHPWFRERRDFYVWAEPGPDGAPPNNWRSLFHSPAWSPGADGLYLHNFLPEQPDLNWWEPGVQQAFEDIIGFWMARGVSGFRVDVANALFHDRELRDNPPLVGGEPPEMLAMGQRPTQSLNRPEAVDVHRAWRRRVEAVAGDDAVLLGETWAYRFETLQTLHGGGDALHLGCNFPLVKAAFAADELRAAVEGTLDHVPAEWNAFFGTNHDVGRMATRWAQGDPGLVRCALMLVLALPGTPILCYGDELGLEDVPVPRERIRDTVGARNWPEDPGRDPCRTPMVWRDTPGGGFTAPDVDPWLPIGPTAPANVEDQQGDPGSPLELTRALLALRRERPDLHAGAYAAAEAPAGAWAFRRGDATLVALNLADETAAIPVERGRVLLGTDRDRDGEAVAGTLSLAPRSGVIVAIGSDSP